MSDGDNVVVAVRVRPFNDREKERNAQLIIDMPNEQVTEIRDPNNSNEAPKRFTFDHSYWSHSGYKSANGYFTPTTSKYADQKKVFDDLGRGVLDNAWKGYNCSLFAYGQTGSGKSYSIVGFGKNKGIVPMVCEELFRQIEENKENKGKVEYQVSLSMLEIYREKIRDLLSNKPPPTGGLKLRENPKTGFYVEGLSSSPVSNYKDIEQKINTGTKTRTIAATNMNATSSRAHTIVKIQFVQKTPKPNGNGATTKTSEINLVDLAGSERQKDAGSEGDRLKEGIVINQSLTTLGRVIKALVDKQHSKSKNIQVSYDNSTQPICEYQIPYRDSVLTSLLKNALGGNTISPADINYEETLSTLRFADRAKSIKTQAVVNESATERMIRELKEENDRLQSMIKKGGTSGSQDELESLKRQLEENQKAMTNLEKKLATTLSRRTKEGEDRSQIEARRKTDPHMWNLNEDPALTDMIVHFIEEGDNRVGNGQSQNSTNIQLKGLSILPDHAMIKNKDNKKFTISPLKATDILVNGKAITGEHTLNQNDRILFGGNHLYVFVNPKKGGVKTSQEITYDTAQKEIAKSVGITNNLGHGKRSKAEVILEEELINLMPNVYRANAMAKELKRNVQFEIVLMAPEIRGRNDGLPEILIRVNNRSDDTTFLWDRSQFMNRYYTMQEMYQNYVENDPNWNLTREKDPFLESPDSSVEVGTVTVFLRSLAYLVEQDEQYPILDVQGSESGQLSVALTPCNSNGKEILGEFVEDPKELVGKNLGFKVKILAALGLPRRVDESWCRYHFYDRDETVTPKVRGHNPGYAHEELFTFRPVDQSLVDYLKDQAIMITICGTQRARDSKTHSNEAMKEINGYLNFESNRAKKSPSKKRDTSKSSEKRRGSTKSKSIPVKPPDDKKPNPLSSSNGSQTRRSPAPPKVKNASTKKPRNKTPKARNSSKTRPNPVTNGSTKKRKKSVKKQNE
ncbi:putative tRNA N6-adenosine threonylcarbamoyltransferase [Aphelenchoides besseyi]|nr:putative tRNA N6-adenosine threonylcarbamoyltransferase [Aphelenchoides besseyi]